MPKSLGKWEVMRSPGSNTEGGKVVELCGLWLTGEEEPEAEGQHAAGPKAPWLGGTCEWGWNSPAEGQGDCCGLRHSQALTWQKVEECLGKGLGNPGSLSFQRTG